jgi:AcrR family transcriptional regulator
MTDDRDMLLGELMAEAVAALRERRFGDVDAILDRAGDDRAELLDMIELALALRGPAEPDPAVIDELAASPLFDVRAWPEVLTEARLAAGLKRPTLVARLAERLGVGDDGRAHLERRYHELETGQLEPRRVRPVVADALGDLLGGIRDTLASTRLNPLPDLGPAAAFNRTGDVLEEHALQMEPPTPTAAERQVDDLFGL